VCEYEVNRLSNEKKLIEENETLMQIVNDAGRPPTRLVFTNL